MFYETATNQHGMKYDPFKALVVPRPIGWVSTISDEGHVDTGATRPIARLGYMEYGVINPKNVFTINRPEVDADGKVANARPEGVWDGQYR